MRLFLRKSPARFLALLAPALVVAACSSPTQPAPASITETFMGTLQPGGSLAHAFTLTATGNIVVTLVRLDPLSTITAGIGIGTQAAGTCNLFGVSGTVMVGSVVTDTEMKGDYCVGIYDTGNVTQAVSYTIRVDHS